MKAMTPANEIPPPRARPRAGVPDRADEPEHGHDRPDDHVLDAAQGRQASVRKSALKKLFGSRAMKPAIRKPAPISFQSIPQSPRKLCATSDQAPTEVSRSRQESCSVPGCDARGPSAPLGVPPLFLLGHRHGRARPHQRDEDEAADELGERELPAEEDPHDDPELEDEIRGGELERHRRCRLAPFWKSDLAIAIAA